MERKIKIYLGEECKLINPNTYYNYKIKTHITEKEVRNFELNLLRHSDFVIVNFNDPGSIGTAQELAVAYEHRIPVIGLNENEKKLHPWLIECCDRIFDNIQELINYANFYYVNS